MEEPTRTALDRVRRRVAGAFPRRRRRRGATEGGSTPGDGLQRTPTLADGAPRTAAGPRLPRRRLLPRRRWVRRLILWGGGAAVALALVTLGAGTWLYSRAHVSTVGDLGFANPLKIPPVLEPDIDADGSKVFELDLQQGTSELVPGTATETWGANGSYLGPTLRASRGDQVVVNVDNHLPESTTLHWHGMHLPADADGNPHQPIAPGDTWSPSWRIDQPAATLWYHPHPHGQTADHVYRGVAGLFLLDDPEAVSGLPADYGVDDIPVILQDKRVDDDGALDMGTPLLSTVSQLGDTILVNGTYDPHVEVRDELVRFRVLNASNGRVYDLGFADDRPFDLVATDGGLLTAPHSTNRAQVSPGERVEIVARFRAGERAVLRSYPPDLGLNAVQGRFSGGDDSFDLLEVRAAPELTESAPLKDTIAEDELPDPADAVTTRQFELNGSSRINGERMDPARIDTVVAVDSTEIWEVTNGSGNPHNFHVHDVQFRIVDYDGGPPPPHLVGPKDTVFLPPRATARLVVRFADYADPGTPYMFHCHVLRHEDNGMMAQFAVVEPDDVEAAPRRIDAHTGHS
ncbi:MAG: multicopper oxidase domain-containing protein [Acidimicrobiia bacterium]|nr:multicopper oxidase domain-containing protein [Acidimicrobiia bacterium]